MIHHGMAASKHNKVHSDGLTYRVPVGTIDAILSYCHNNLADNTLTSLLDYFHEKKVVVIRCCSPPPEPPEGQAPLPLGLSAYLINV